MLYKNHTTVFSTLLGVLLLSCIWICALYGDVVFAFLGVSFNYENEPFLTSAYLAVWIALALAFFPKVRSRVNTDGVLDTIAVLVVFFAGLVVLYGYVLPTFEKPAALIAAHPYVFFLDAGSAYLAPKAIEVVLQQILIAALVLLLDAYKPSLLFVSIAYACIFGPAHLLLLTVAPSDPFFVLFGVFAVLSAFVFPYLILKVRNGFVYSYMLHMSFYVGLTLWFYV